MTDRTRIMRDVLLQALHSEMGRRGDIYFLTADFGAPSLDDMRRDFPKRVINVGIAEQNLIAVATGLALEGCTVYAYAIAPFLTMRAFEQIRTNLSLLAQGKDVNVNLIGVGAGMSYDLSGPTHHCLEDITVIRSLPNIIFFSPSDAVLLRRFLPFSMDVRRPKYLRLDGKPLIDLYDEEDPLSLEVGFNAIRKGKEVCIVSTGFMTHRALAVAGRLALEGVEIGVIDLYMLKTVDKGLLSKELSLYQGIITLEEGFSGKGGLDSLVLAILAHDEQKLTFKGLGFGDSYLPDVGGRAYLHSLAGLDDAGVAETVRSMLRKIR